MKKFLHLALVFLIIFNSAGYVFTYWQLKKIFKQTALKKIEQSIPDNQLQLIVAALDGNPLDGVNCKRVNKKEFLLNNEMYDIVRSEIKGNEIHYYCLKDENENQLEAVFINYVEGNSASPAGTVPVKNLMKSFSGDWENVYNTHIFFTGSENLIVPFKRDTIFEFHPVIIPPPKIFSC